MGSFFFLGVGSAGPGRGLAGFFASGGSGRLGRAWWGKGPVGRLRSSNEFALPDRGFSGALSVGRALPPRTGEGPAGGSLSRSVGGSG